MSEKRWRVVTLGRWPIGNPPIGGAECQMMESYEVSDEELIAEDNRRKQAFDEMRKLQKLKSGCRLCGIESRIDNPDCPSIKLKAAKVYPFENQTMVTTRRSDLRHNAVESVQQVCGLHPDRE